MSAVNATPLLAAAGGDYQISRSVRLRSSASASLTRTLGSGSGTTSTLSAWVKRGSLGTNNAIMCSVPNGTQDTTLAISSDTLSFSSWDGAGGRPLGYLITTQVLRDPSAWYHLVMTVDTANATSTERLRLYINGVRVTAFSTATYPSQNATWYWNQAQPHRIGRLADSAGGGYSDQYLTEINFIDGQALTPSSFGETDAVTGVWKPKKYAGTYGTNGFYLNFSDPSAATAAAIGKDYSGNGNNWTPNNISVTAGATYDSMLDVPTLWADGGNGRGNYAVISPISNAIAYTITNGNLSISNGSVARGTKPSSFFLTSGKWYWEVVGNGYCGAVCGNAGAAFTNSVSATGSNAIGYWEGGLVYWDGGNSGAGPASYNTTDVIGVALDMGAGTVAFYKNNSLQYTATFGSGGVPNLSAGCFPCYNDGASATAKSAAYNFGQRPFAYTPPTGFKALNTQNLPEPTIKKGNQYFDATTYTGNGSTQSIVNAGGFQPDLVWLKARSVAESHELHDAVRGASNLLKSNSTAAELNATNTLTSFNSNGFSLGSSTEINTNAATFVGWQWKESPSAGFDIVTYTGTGVNRTVAHNLGVAPNLIIVKNRGATAAWAVRHSSLGANDYLLLNLTNAVGTSSTVFNGAPSSTVFNVGTDVTTNANTNTYVAYLFAEVAGFSKFGSYTGNGSADGPFVFCNFAPAFIMLKRTDSTGNWSMYDRARSTRNPDTKVLYPNLSNAEDASTDHFDWLSNGFKMKSTNQNASGGTFIFAAFAEHPFKNSLAR